MKKKKNNKLKLEEEKNEDDLDIYVEENMEAMLEDDEISDAESGFMLGYTGDFDFEDEFGE